VCCGSAVRALLRLASVVTRFRIALADAFHDEAEMYAAALEHYGFAVHPIETADVTLACAAIVRLRPDAVLTRILPGRFGIDLVRRLRADVTMARRPIVIFTSLAHSDVLDEARGCGATDVLLLPVGVDDIAQILRRHLPTRRSA
jgi:DNA-binding response OmpR family regulator